MTTTGTLGAYALERHIARGGMGDVWQARRHGAGDFQRRVALKRIHPELVHQEGFVDQFLREARLGGLLHHPNVVPVLDAGNHEGNPYLVMEWVDGADLRRLVARGRARGVTLSPALVGHVVHEVLAALEAAQAVDDGSGQLRGLVHRDISPENVMVGRFGEVRVTDFGLAREVAGSSLTEPGVVKGKLSYMSPEQIAGLPLDGRSDLFSVGIMFHELLVGERPYEATNPLLAMEHARSPGVHPLKSAPGLPPALAELAWRWRQPFPDERAPSIARAREELLHVLRTLLQGVPSADMQAFYERLSGAGQPPAREQLMATLKPRPCAKCGGNLVADMVLGGVIVDRCPDCHGMFLERMEQSRILGGEARLEVTGDVWAAPGSGGELDHVRGECPGCGVPLDRVKAHADHSFHVERCARCSGLWFDAGELEAVAGDVADAVRVLGRLVPTLA